MYKIISLLFAMSLLFSCGQQTKKSDLVSQQEVLPLSVGDFLSDAGPFTDQTVKINGTVVHVCRHGGQRLFIVGEDGEKRIRITTGEDIPEFDVELEGVMIEVTGVVKELIIDETYLAEWEVEVTEGSKHDRGEGHEGGVGHGDDHGESAGEEAVEAEEQMTQQLARIQELRDEIAESGKDHLSDYWIETIEYKVIED